MKIFKNLILITTIILLFSGCNGNNHIIAGNAFGTIFYIELKGYDDNLDLKKIHLGINNIIDNIDNSASNYKENSEISEFNFSNKLIKQFSKHLFLIIKKAMYASERTDGFFDITIGDIKIRKGFYQSPVKVPNNRKNNFNYKNIVLLNEKNTIKRNNKNIIIDLSGIAKGYAVDLIYNFLDDKNISDFTINIGGEIRIKTSNEITTIAIDDPSRVNKFIENVNLPNTYSIASSGTYNNTIKYKNNNISHIINPKDLSNKEQKYLLVSVVHNECAIADAIATGLIAMDVKDIINFSNKNNIASMLIISNDSHTKKYYSKKFLKYIEN